MNKIKRNASERKPFSRIESDTRSSPTKLSAGREDEGSSPQDAEILQEEDSDARLPKYAVILHNDDYTTMEFVIEVLRLFFGQEEESAERIMLAVHQRGRGVAGVYSFEIAETKVEQVHQLARSRGFPLLCTIEEAQS